MGIDHSIKHRKISRICLEGTLHQSITLLEKKKGINNRKETMPIDRHIHSSKVVVNPHQLLMAHGLCMFTYRGLTWQ
jgi:succinate dehydrogenase/fumarate reductase flavoprotein subunit